MCDIADGLLDQSIDVRDWRIGTNTANRRHLSDATAQTSPYQGRSSCKE